MVLAFTIKAPAQSAYHINTAQGLQTNAITDITRDRNNNMWIGTYNGLYKHEGTTIKEFITAGKTDKDLSGLEMHSVLEDRLGFIWAGTTNGLDKIDPYTYKVTHYPIRSKDSGSSFVGYIYSVFQDDEDFIWICTDAALFRMNYTTGEYTKIPMKQDKTGLPTSSVSYNSGIKTGKGIYIHNHLGMGYYEYSTKQFYHRYHNPNKNPVFDLYETTRQGAQSDMDTDSSGNIWFVAKAGLLACYNWKTNKLDSFRFKHPANAWFCCYSVKADSKKNIWIGFRHGGLMIFDIVSKTFTPVKYKELNSLISSNYIYSLERDYKGQMWVATDNGVDVIDYYNQAILSRQLTNRSDFLNVRYQSGDISTDGNQSIFIPFYQFGFLKYAIASDSVQFFQAGSNPDARGALYIIAEGNNEVWASRDKKLVKVNLLNNKISTPDYKHLLPGAIEKFPGDVIWYKKENEKSFFVRKNGGHLLHIKNDSTEVLRSYGFKKNTALSADKKGLWYLTTWLDLVKKNFADYSADTIQLQQLLKKIDFSFANPRDIADDGEHVWMTGQNGLLCYNYKKGALKTYTGNEGLSHTFTFALVIDNDNNVWVQSLGGIDVFDKKTGLFKQAIGHTKGTYMDAFGSAIKMNDGRLAFHSGNYLHIINPAEFAKTYMQKQMLQIQEVKINGNSISLQDNKILSELSYTQNNMEVRFGLLDFDIHHTTIYWYKLDGGSNRWVSHGKNNTLLFNELQPGKYTLHIKVTDASGNSIADEKSISFQIYPPYWKSWWFRLLLICAIAAILYFIYSLRVKNIRDKAALQQQLTELEAKAIRAQMNPHFIFNSLNAIQELIVTNKTDEGYQYLSNFSKLQRMVLNNSETNFITLSQEIELIHLYLSLESLRFKKSFAYNLSIDDNIETDLAKVPTMLLQPYIENAIWHGLRHKDDDKKLSIDIAEKDHNLIIKIDDNGIGREKAATIKTRKMGSEQFASKGTLLAQQRIDLLNKQYGNKVSVSIIDKKDKEGNATGTTIILVLPENFGK